jgi:hypothetical protein
MALKDMSLTPEQAKAQMGYCSPADGDDDADDSGPKYPWGLSISLDDDAMAKLGLSAPQVGSTMHMLAVVQITNYGLNEDQKGSDQSMTLQITAMDLQPAGKPDVMSRAAGSIYGGNND